MQVPIKLDLYTMDQPSTKASLLLQCHFSRQPLPCTDYLTDTKSVLDQAPRVLQAMVDLCAESGWLDSTLRVINMLQMLVQARWDNQSALLTLPAFTDSALHLLESQAVLPASLPGLVHWARANNKVSQNSKVGIV